tara:strand:+ start:1482 stop:1706 length:225 start_codon:yes stop_codon:yes gene_type:complete
MLPPAELYLQQQSRIPNEEEWFVFIDISVHIISVEHEHDVAYVNDFIYSTDQGSFYCDIFLTGFGSIRNVLGQC